jgi:hypothetical protein
MWACSYAAAEIIVGPRRLLIALRLSLDRLEKGDHVPALLHIVHLKQHGMLHFPAIDLVKEGFGIADILEQSVVGPRDILGVGADHALGIFGEVGSAARRRSVYFVQIRSGRPRRLVGLENVAGPALTGRRFTRLCTRFQ